MLPGCLWALLHLNDCLNARLPHHPPTLECDHCTVVPCLYLANILTNLIGIMFIGTTLAPNNWKEVICKSFIVTFPCKWFSPVSSFPLPDTGKLLAPTYHGVTNKTLWNFEKMGIFSFSYLWWWPSGQLSWLFFFGRFEGNAWAHCWQMKLRIFMTFTQGCAV